MIVSICIFIFIFIFTFTNFNGMGPYAILIVDDDSNNRELIKRYLLHDGYSLIEASDGLEALTLARYTPNLRVVLMDINMPVMDGITSLNHLRASHPSLPVIAVTASIEEFSTQQCQTWGFNDILIKPFTRQELQALIRSFIS